MTASSVTTVLFGVAYGEKKSFFCIKCLELGVYKVGIYVCNDFLLFSLYNLYEVCIIIIIVIIIIKYTEYNIVFAN